MTAPGIDPFVGQFLAIVAVMAALLGWLRADMPAGQAELRTEMNVLRTELGAVRAEVGGLSERTVRIETGQASAAERMARIESTVAGALCRPFPGANRVAEAPAADADPAPEG